jgi:hypothetical protein
LAFQSAQETKLRPSAECRSTLKVLALSGHPREGRLDAGMSGRMLSKENFCAMAGCHCIPASSASSRVLTL